MNVKKIVVKIPFIVGFLFLFINSYSQNYIKINSFAELENRYVMINNFDAPLYKEHNITGEQITEIPYKTILLSEEQNFGWHKVVYEGDIGWVFGMDVYEVNKEGVRIIYCPPKTSNTNIADNNQNTSNNYQNTSNNNQVSQQYSSFSQPEIDDVKKYTKSFAERFFQNVEKSENTIHSSSNLEVTIIDAQKATRGNNVDMYDITVKISWRFSWKDATFISTKNIFEGVLSIRTDGTGGALFFISRKNDDFSTKIERLHDDVRNNPDYKFIDEICPDAKWFYYE